jgi:hypothetical protein
MRAEESFRLKSQLAVDVPLDGELLKADDLNRELMLRALDAKFHEAGLDNVGRDELIIAYDAAQTYDYRLPDAAARQYAEQQLAEGNKTVEFWTDVRTVENAIDRVQERRAFRAQRFREAEQRLRDAPDYGGEAMLSFLIAHVNGVVNTINGAKDLASWAPRAAFGWELPDIPKIGYVGEYGQKYGRDMELGVELGLMFIGGAAGGAEQLASVLGKAEASLGSLLAGMTVRGVEVGPRLIQAAKAYVAVGAGVETGEMAWEAGGNVAVLLSAEATPEQKREAAHELVESVGLFALGGVLATAGRPDAPDHHVAGDGEASPQAPQTESSSHRAPGEDGPRGEQHATGKSSPEPPESAAPAHDGNGLGPASSAEVPDPGAAAAPPPAAAPPASAQSTAWRDIPADHLVSPDGRITGIRNRVAADTSRQYEVVGEIGEPLGKANRQNYERKVLEPVAGMDNAHLWGPNFGSETGHGIMYAPPEFNRSVQRYVENRIGDAYQAAKRHGNRLLLEVTGTSKPVSEHGGKEYLDSVRYRAVEVDANNNVVHRHLDVTLGVRDDGKVDLTQGSITTVVDPAELVQPTPQPAGDESDGSTGNGAPAKAEHTQSDTDASASGSEPSTEQEPSGDGGQAGHEAAETNDGGATDHEAAETNDSGGDGRGGESAESGAEPASHDIAPEVGGPEAHPGPAPSSVGGAATQPGHQQATTGTTDDGLDVVGGETESSQDVSAERPEEPSGEEAAEPEGEEESEDVSQERPEEPAAELAEERPAEDGPEGGASEQDGTEGVNQEEAGEAEQVQEVSSGGP